MLNHENYQMTKTISHSEGIIVLLRDKNCNAIKNASRG